MKILSLIFLLVSPLAGMAAAHPSDSWEWTLESGYLWKVGSNSDIDYEIIPTQLSLRTPVVWTWWEAADGAKLVVWSRYSALWETITSGPEDVYLGVTAAPSIEYWFPSQMTSAFFSIGGGFGWLDSSGGEQGQGQDFTLNWFSQLGLRQKITANVSLLGAIYFTHHSNLGMTDPNPGIDAIGFTLGAAWKF